MDAAAFDAHSAQTRALLAALPATLADFMRSHRRENAIFRLIADNANDIIVLLSADETVLYASAATARILGYTELALIGRRLQDFLHPDDPPIRLDRPATPAIPRMVLRWRASDGRYVLLEPTFRPMQEGQEARTIGVLRDVTEQVRLEEQVHHRQKMDAVGQLTAGIAHDFNNLLQTMMGSLELLLDAVGDRVDVRECVEGALRAGERGARLTNHLLAFARKQVLKPRALDLSGLLKEVAHTLHRTLGPRIALELAIAPEPLRVNADPGQLEAAVLNLALNARDAMLQGGTLTIKACRSPNNGREVVLAVSDTGIGMDTGTLARACEPFFTTKGPNGTGLGLPMVHDFARQSGGDMQVQSAPGRGTRVEIRLPAARGPVAAAGNSTTPVAAGRGRVLLVDDEAEVLATLGHFLKGAGFVVRTVGTGDEALAVLAAGEAADAMVADYAMPGLAGAEFVAAVRQIAADLPILVVSGYAEAERLAEPAGNVRVMRKPFRRLALVQEVAALIEGGGTGDDNRGTERPD